MENERNKIPESIKKSLLHNNIQCNKFFKHDFFIHYDTILLQLII